MSKKTFFSPGASFCALSAFRQFGPQQEFQKWAEERAALGIGLAKARVTDFSCNYDDICRRFHNKPRTRRPFMPHNLLNFWFVECYPEATKVLDIHNVD